MFIIESSIPCPKKKTKYPFNQMKVGDSFLVHDDNSPTNAVNAAHTYGRYWGRKFASQSVGMGVRIWRIA